MIENTVPMTDVEKQTRNKQLMYGGLLVGATALYLMMTKNDKTNVFSGIEGLGIDLDPSRLVDSSVDKIVGNEIVRRGAKHLVKKIGYKMLERG